MGTAGNLISPVMVDGNTTFYAWDASGNGNFEPLVDAKTHDYLDGIFKYASDFTTVNPGASTTNTYRYGTMTGTINGVAQNFKLALPVAGGTVSGGIETDVGTQATGTAIGNATASLGSTVTNPTYDGLLAIWDAYNGTGTAVGGSGVPTDWSGTANLWSATPGSGSTTENHAYITLGTGAITAATDTTNAAVVFQVL